MTERITELWEVLVPVQANSGKEWPIEHHHEWDEQVRRAIGGLTIMRTAKGQWVDSDGTLFNERMIPVRLACDESQVRQVMSLTMTHYDQLAVMAYRVSDRSIVMSATD
jgi:hypothetical protein